ncbi:MAG: CTP synthase (glutamine hydrolyzing) [Candidatus ainarchaeum sp.]|nr:CTP synthase (glutamine hydrolyzing) [Candidatus ainarchaeum sp.]
MGEKKPKLIFVAGSIMSGLGKGILTASIAKLLQSRGYSIIPIKFDGYLNVDCGTMNPFRHGEVFVLDDGSEVDLDFGTYERFLNISLNQNNSITGGKLFRALLEKERRGDFLGRDVQFIPHLTNEIKERISTVSKETNADIIIVEIGGTVGDMENGYFLEAVRQLYNENPESLFVQLTYVPSISQGEQKTKPTQQANRLIQSMGIKPDIIVCREQEPLKKEAKEKISLFCDVPIEAIFDDPMVDTVYELPLVLEKQGIYEVISKKLNLMKKEEDLKNWRTLVSRIKNPTKGTLRIGVIGKYTEVKDAYLSIKEALLHSAANLGVSIIVDWLESTDFEEKNDYSSLKKLDGIIVPGGFGKRGIEGKITAIKFARENNIPFLGLCLGMQLMVVEFARNVCSLEEANSKEFNANTPHPIICLLPEQHRIIEKGGTMRLGAYDAKLEKGTFTYKTYNQETISERHRHRYEVNPDYVDKLKEKGLIISGVHTKNNIVEIAEWPNNYGFGVATQAHIELKSRLENPAPLFLSFIKAAMKEK